MRNLGEKIMIYSMVGMIQIGFGATVVAASPLYNDGPWPQPVQRHHEPQPPHLQQPFKPDPGPDVPGPDGPETD